MSQPKADERIERREEIKEKYQRYRRPLSYIATGACVLGLALVSVGASLKPGESPREQNPVVVEHSRGNRRTMNSYESVGWAGLGSIALAGVLAFGPISILYSKQDREIERLESLSQT